MYVNICPSDALKPEPVLQHQRVKGNAVVSFKSSNNATRLDRLYQHGSAKVRFPKTHGRFCEAVLINTAGGLTGGDRLDWSINLDDATNAIITTQACEKSYRSSSDTAHVSTTLCVGENSTCHWLPQETILYEGSHLSRKLDIDLAPTASLIALEAVMLGREAMGEAVVQCNFNDRWRIRRNGKLIFADDVRLDGNICKFENDSAALSGQKAFATLLYCGTEGDDQLELVAENLRKILDQQYMSASVFNNKLVARFLATNTYELRRYMMPVLKELSGADLPRVWRI